MLIFSQSSYVEPLTPNVMVFGGRAFGNLADLGEVMRVRPSQKSERDQRSLSPPREVQ
jgi:hypothetical protein